MTLSQTVAQALVHAHLGGRPLDEHSLAAAVDVAEDRVRTGMLPVRSDLLRHDLDNRMETSATSSQLNGAGYVSKTAMGAEWKSRTNPGFDRFDNAGESAAIFVIDDHPIMRSAIASLIRRLRANTRISEFGSLAEVPPSTGSQRLTAALTALLLKSSDVALDTEGDASLRVHASTNMSASV